MVTHTPVYHRFAGRLNEVRHLYRLSRSYELTKNKVKIGKADHVNALVRSAVVMLSAHVQGYVEDYADHIVHHVTTSGIDRSKLPDRLFYFAARKLIEPVQANTDPDNIIAKLREFDRNARALVLAPGPISTSLTAAPYKDGFGNPTTKEILKFFKRFGCEALEGDMKAKLKGRYPFAKNAVDFIVEQRSKIAHGGATATTTPKEFREYLQLVDVYCSAADYLLARHFNSKLGCRLW
jgi:hypothetical protein